MCLDQHLSGPRRDKLAFLWVGEPGDERRFTYAEVHAEVCRLANALKSRGVKIGVVTSGLYEKAWPELVSAFRTIRRCWRRCAACRWKRF